MYLIGMTIVKSAKGSDPDVSHQTQIRPQSLIHINAAAITGKGHHGVNSFSGQLKTVENLISSMVFSGGPEPEKRPEKYDISS